MMFLVFFQISLEELFKRDDIVRKKDAEFSTVIPTQLETMRTNSEGYHIVLSLKNFIEHEKFADSLISSGRD